MRPWRWAWKLLRRRIRILTFRVPAERSWFVQVTVNLPLASMATCGWSERTPPPPETMIAEPNLLPNVSNRWAQMSAAGGKTMPGVLPQTATEVPLAELRYPSSSL